MAPPVLNVTCHITLQHDLVNTAYNYGFILNNDSDHATDGPAVSIQKQVDSDGRIITKVFFTVFLADSQVNPDGTTHAETRAEMYAMLLNFLSQRDRITLTCSAGIIPNLCSLGHVSTEYHYGSHSLVVCQLTDLAVYYPPADPIAFNLSVWDGGLTWNTSYWRNTSINQPQQVP